MKTRIQKHFSSSEENERIKYYARYFIWHKTANITEAEEDEGEIFDDYVRKMGHFPFANKIKPPRSTLTDEEMAEIFINECVRVLDRWFK